jgi:hypothetical protein
MSMKQQLNSILSKEMDRKDFLKHLAVGSVAVVGAGWLLRFTTTKPEQKVSSGGYGDSAYGGATRPSNNNKGQS